MTRDPETFATTASARARERRKQIWAHAREAIEALSASTLCHAAAAIATSIRYSSLVPQVASRTDQTPSILPQLVARIVEVLHPVQIWLFGSRARGEARVDSDWDFMAILPDEAPEEDLDLCSVWQRLRDLQLQRVELFTMTQSEFEDWNRSLGTLAEIVASTGIVVYGG